MNPSHSVGRNQDAGLGGWHPAQRPNTHEASDRYEGQEAALNSLLGLDGKIASSPEITDSMSELEPSTQKPDAAGTSLKPHASLEDGQENTTEIRTANHSTSTVAADNEDRLDAFQQQKSSVKGQSDRGAGNVPYEQNVQPDLEAEPQMSPDGKEDDSSVLNAPPLGAASQCISEETYSPTQPILNAAPSRDEFDMLGAPDRTNSFPDVPPVQSSKLPLHALPHSQAEDIMESNEADSSTDFSAQENGVFANYSSDSAAQDPFRGSQDDGEDDFYGRGATLQRDMPTPPDNEARYEEGLSLVSPGSQEGKIPQGTELEPRTEGGVLNDARTSEDDFFDNITSPTTNDQSVRPQPLDRKTTSQVLDSMTFAPHSETHEDFDAAKDRPSPTNLTSGGIAVSSSTAISQVFAEQHSAGTQTKGKDEDLAAMWQAALDDDELLEDNPTVDSSSLFEDGEDFLASEIDKPLSQSDSSPSLQPVYSPDGRMQWFTNANTPGDRSGSSTQNTYTPNPLTNAQMQSSQACGPQPSFAGPSQTLPPSTGNSNSSLPTPTTFQGYPRQPPAYGNLPSSLRAQIPSSAQSFADKSKGGYTSPYDLPMDVAKPKKRNHTQQLRPGAGSSIPVNRPAPPPRSSSMFSSGNPVVDAHPPLPSLPSATGSLPGDPVTASTSKSRNGTGDFFEELPSVKPRPSTRSVRPSPPVQKLTGPRQMPQVPQSHQQADLQAATHVGNSAGALSSEQIYGLVPPARAGLYENVPQQAPSRPVAPSVNSRYSPAPASQNHVPPARTRYAASPSGGPQATHPQPRSFQPRTSSPLAHAGAKVQHQQFTTDTGPVPSTGRQQPPFTEGYEQDMPAAAVEHSIVPERSTNSQPSPPLQSSRYGPLSSSSTPSGAIDTPESDQPPSTGHFSGSQIQEQQFSEPDHVGFAHPRRSQTQSPGAVRSQPSLPTRAKDLYQRPASVNERDVQKPLPNTTKEYPTSRRTRGFSQSVDYITPTDGREHDPLGRWKGCPIFKFGFGGMTISSFPKQIPRYTSGRNKPMMKCSPGEVKVQAVKALALDEDFKDFPGPLKFKNKKKEVLEWLHRRLTQMEGKYEEIAPGSVLPDRHKRHEEKILLWRILQVLVEYDGVIEGQPPAEKAIRVILSPVLAEGATDNLPTSSNAELLGITRSTGSSNIPDPTSPQDLESLRQILLRGEREKAVWHALDRRMWAHAMLISSTMEKNIWKQVLQEFIRQEVKSFGENTESLAALYQIFAGNWEESVDELVPPSARAGLQFVSKAANAGPTRNALEGLDRWRETLTLALSNRSQEDGKALEALGRLLSGYGRTEAAHICFIFARSPGMFGGADDPSVNIALLGADHLSQPDDFSRDVDSVLLTEIYDFACTILVPSASTTVFPHLQAYKLYHAMLLAEYGYRSEAQQYCESITGSLKSTTKRSLYYHDLLFEKLDDLVSRLRQAPVDNSSSWMSKPSLDKVSGSFFSKFNQFIAGDDSDADSAVSAKGASLAAGPFAGVSGGTPNVSRPSSSGDLYGSYPAPQPLSGGTVAASRYAPSGQYAPQGQYTPRSSLEQNGRPSPEYRGPSQHEGLKPANMNPQPSPTLSRQSSSANIYQQPPLPQAKSSHQPQGYPSRGESYLPTPPSHPEYMSEPPPEEMSRSLYEQEPYHPTPPLGSQPMQSPQGQYDSGTRAPVYNHPNSSPSHPPPQIVAEPPTSYLPPASSYEPPTHESKFPASGFEPASINAYQPSPYALNVQNAPAEVESPVEEKTKKKSFMDDDDDDFVARAAAVLKQEKAQKDWEADDAFRKAAEADAQKGGLKPKKSGWLGGWFGGAKTDDLSAQSAVNGPIKAKLGEQSSFYYDKGLKKWVNKKGGDMPAPTETARPPPPKGPPSRAVSASGAPPPRSTDTPPVPPLPSTATPPINITGPPAAALTASPGSNPSGQPSRAASPMPMGEQPALGAGLSAGLSGSVPPSAPPSRPATAMSNASTIDDLIGAPQARKGGTIKKGKKGRGYVDVMAK